MISTPTRTTATVSPLTPLANGSAAAQSAHSGFAAALRQLAKQAEDPRGSSPSSESSVSSPATCLSNSVTTPKRGLPGPLQTSSGVDSLPSTPPGVTIAPTHSKTSNILCIGEGHQAESGVCGVSRESVGSELSPTQKKGGYPVPSHHVLAHSSYPFSLTPSSVMQDRRLQGLSLPGQVHPAVPSGTVPEEYLRGLRPFATSEDLRLRSLHLGLDPVTAAHVTAAAAYYHPAYLHHLHRMEESLCLSALRSQFYSVPAGGAFSTLHPSALHMHVPGARYPGELSHTQSAIAERLQMEEDLRQREKQRELELEREREREQDRERERERERQREREREREMVKAVGTQYLAGLKALTAPPEDRVRPGERLTPKRLGKPTLPALPVPKPLQPDLQSSRGSASHPILTLVPSQMGNAHTASASTGGLHGTLASAMKLQQANGEKLWLSKQRRQGQESEAWSPGEGVEPRRHSNRSNASQRDPGNRESQPHLGAPPPLISPKAHPHLLPHPPVPPTTLWNPASLTETSPDPRRRFDSPIPPSRLPPGLTRAEWPPSWERGEEGCRRMGEGPERFSFIRGPVLQISGLWSMAELERSTHSLHHQHNHHHNHLHQKGSLLLSSPSPSSDLGVQRPSSSPSPSRDLQKSEPPGQEPQNPVVYDKILQQQHRLVSKLDLEESRRREAREGGYYYDLDESYDESDEEEVKAHLRRVAEQPPLKLDTSSEKVCFLRVCGLTTLAHRDQLFHQKRRKRRRMLRERSISPPPVQGKRKTPCSTVAPVPPLSTTLTPEEMDCFPQLEDKKHFLNMLSLSHVTSQQRRDKEKMEGLLKAIKLKRVTLDTIRYNPLPLCSSTPVLSTGDYTPDLPACKSNGLDYPDSPSPLPPYPHHPDNLHTDPLNPQPPPPRHPPPLGLHPDRAGLCERHPSKRLQGLQNGASHLGHPTQLKVPLAGQNGQNKPWERFIREDFAQHFHQAVLQSTHKTLGSSICVPESSIKSEPSAPYNIPPLKRPDPLHTPPHPTNGHHPYPSPPHHDPDGVRVERSEEDEEEDEEETPRKWKGIESVFEAYQEYVDERGMERQVLHSQCRRLETQNYTLSLTAEQLSHSMAELLSQRQRVRDERERLQAQLEHFRKCLTLPNVHWGKGQLKGHLPR
ncbi:genetic suppressor element 1-like [Oncorhynchus mykiss]|uniref:Genetic suppressor element-like domain-containing protein n=1 Tax=Oncorhynchus mykiss TaxID=8022 RepID=A0A8C7SSA3_ONCMY|nr:genetic suppressor element 1-like [Oncorhynchus mykiss]XP_036811965.1 genetic suppressor element 1-like [Oncorhynchus mykiss]